MHRRLSQINAGDHEAGAASGILIEETATFKVAFIVWVLGTVLAGIALMTVLMIPGLADQAMTNIPRAVLAGVAVAIPLSHLVTRTVAGPSVR